MGVRRASGHVKTWGIEAALATVLIHTEMAGFR